MKKQSNPISFSIDKKLISLVMTVSIVTISASAFLSFNYATEILQTRMGDQLISESTIRGDTILSLIHTRMKDTQILATDPMIRNLVSELNHIEYDPNYYSTVQEKRRDFLTQIQAFQALVGFSIGLEDVKIIGQDGKVFFSLVRLPKTDNFENDPIFVRGMVEPFVEFVPAENGRTKMLVVMPIFGQDGSIGGIVAATMRNDEINDVLLNRSGLGETGEVYLVNEDYVMISESRFLKNAAFSQTVDTYPVRECFENNKEVSGIYPDYRGVSIFGFSYCVPDLGFVLIAEIDESETLQPVLILQDRIFLTGIGITIVMAIIAFLISKLLSRPIIKLQNATEEIAKGNYKIRTNIKTRDEIGKLASSFDSMAQKLQESLITIKQKEDVIKQQEDILLNFSDRSENDCVCLVDIKNSTKITAEMSDSESSVLYSVFLNHMAEIVKKYKGIVVKNIGDALLFYFQDMNPYDKSSFKNVLECCLSISESHDLLGQKLEKNNLPRLDYKISATYGSVRIANTSTSDVNDIFGSTVNRCAKINGLSPSNGLVIGESFYGVVKDFEEYNFTKMDKQMPDTDQQYVVYVVTRRKSTNN